MPAAIVVEGLERAFGEVKAVQGIEIEVAEGEIYGFLGPNGAGKTTTVRMLTTLLLPTGGRASVAGHDVAKEARQVRRTIGVALQEAALDPLMTGRELIRLQATLQGIPTAEGRERGDALLDRVGLSDAADRRVGGYSGGMQRRLDLAAALVHEPRVLFLDEPTTGLDPVSRKTIWEEVRALNDEGTTVFLTTQYLEEADQLADNVGIIDNGRLVAEGTPDALKSDIGHPHIRLQIAEGSIAEAERAVGQIGKLLPPVDGKTVLVEVANGAKEIPAVVRTLDEAGIAVGALELVHPTLDDVFVAKTGYHLAEESEENDEKAPVESLSGLRTNLRVVKALGLRSVRQTFRRPQLLAPIVVFPTILLAIQTGGAGAAIELPGFPPVQSFLQFMLAGAMMQSLMLAGNSGGIALAVDIEMGFTDRLFAAPISRFTIVLGRLAGTAALGLFGSLWFLAIGLIFGAEIESGVPGALIAIVLVTSSALAVGGIGAAIALRTGSASVVQGLFPLVLVVLFVSSAFFPVDLMIEPAKVIAEYNPMSFIVEGIREPIISGIDASDLLGAVAAILGIFALGLVLSARALRHRLRVG